MVGWVPSGENGLGLTLGSGVPEPAAAGYEYSGALDTRMGQSYAAARQAIGESR